MRYVNMLLLMIVFAFLAACDVDEKQIIDAEIGDNSHLIITYADETEEDLGVVVGEDGVDGSNGIDGQTPYIGENGNWWIGSTDTDVYAGYPNSNNFETGTFQFGLNTDGKSYYLISYTGMDRYVVVPEDYNGLPVTAIGVQAFIDNVIVQHVTLPKTIEAIEAYAFYGCTSLVSINLPEGLKEIEAYAFYEASSLESVVMPNTITEIGTYAFYGLRSLSELSISTGISEIKAYTFSRISTLTSLHIPGNVEIIYECAFEYSGSIEQLFIHEGVLHIGYRAFKNFIQVTSIYLPDSLTGIGSEAFSGNYDLRSIYIPDINFMMEDVFLLTYELTVYCEATSIPDGWHSNWDTNVFSVVWGATRPI